MKLDFGKDRLKSFEKFQLQLTDLGKRDRSVLKRRR